MFETSGLKPKKFWEQPQQTNETLNITKFNLYKHFRIRHLNGRKGRDRQNNNQRSKVCICITSMRTGVSVTNDCVLNAFFYSNISVILVVCKCQNYKANKLRHLDDRLYHLKLVTSTTPVIKPWMGIKATGDVRW